MFRPQSMLPPPSHPRLPPEPEYAYDRRWEQDRTFTQQPYAFTPGDVVTIYNEDEVDPTFNMPPTFVDATYIK